MVVYFLKVVLLRRGRKSTLNKTYLPAGMPQSLSTHPFASYSLFLSTSSSLFAFSFFICPDIVLMLKNLFIFSVRDHMEHVI